MSGPHVNKFHVGGARLFLHPFLPFPQMNRIRPINKTNDLKQRCAEKKLAKARANAKREEKKRMEEEEKTKLEEADAKREERAKKKAEEEKKKHAEKRKAEEAMPVCCKGCFS